MKLIVGLGNPGEKYLNTRHNLGFLAIDKFLQDITDVQHTVWSEEKSHKAEIATFNWQPERGELEKLILAKPLTYMNNSGMAVKLLADYYKISPQDIIILHDDVDLQPGLLRIRFGGAAGGHHGVESIIDSLDTDTFWRFKLGIGRPGRMRDGEYQMKDMHGVDDYVLGNFTAQDWKTVRELIERSSKALQCSLEESIESSMNKYNSK